LDIFLLTANIWKICSILPRSGLNDRHFFKLLPWEEAAKVIVARFMLADCLTIVG